MSAFEPITPRDAFAISPHASDPLAKKADGLWIGTGGTVVVTTLAGTDVTFVAAAGSVIPLQVTHVKTGGTASDIVGFVY